MDQLRLLQLEHVELTGDYGYLPKHLRWIYWKRFPLKYMPKNFFLGGVIAIDLKHSNLRLVWKEPQVYIIYMTISFKTELNYTSNCCHLPLFHFLFSCLFFCQKKNFIVGFAVAENPQS